MIQIIPLDCTKLGTDEMLQAAISGRKTQFRYIINPQPDSIRKGMVPCKHSEDWELDSDNQLNLVTLVEPIRCPYKIGDILWVRENWFRTDGEYLYRADQNFPEVLYWNPSWRMPKEACRLFLQITKIRVERLQDISSEDAIAEGIEELPVWPEAPDLKRFKLYSRLDLDSSIAEPATFEAQASFLSLCARIQTSNFVLANPWVWVIEFNLFQKK